MLEIVGSFMSSTFQNDEEMNTSGPTKMRKTQYLSKAQNKRYYQGALTLKPTVSLELPMTFKGRRNFKGTSISSSEKILC